MFEKAQWIRRKNDTGDRCPVFSRRFNCYKIISEAKLFITAMGVYEAIINGNRVGDFILAPGWTSYDTRLQYQEYDITSYVKSKNEIQVTVGRGWYSGTLTWNNKKNFWGSYRGLIAEIHIKYQDGSMRIITTDDEWESADSQIMYSEIYHGETFDAHINTEKLEKALVFEGKKSNLIPQEGEIVTEQEILTPIQVIQTPKGEKVIDFGQNMTGYVEFTITAKEGDRVLISHAEVLDKDGNFYTENLRSAKQQLEYICKEGKQTYKPHFTFMGFRFIRLDEFPNTACLINISAIAVHSNLKRTGYIESSNALLNQLYSNIIWGQKSNFLDIPSDCPQRDERLGWTGDAQVFIKTASYNYDVKRFFQKWLRDLKAEQFPDGNIPNVVPNVLQEVGSAAWGDAAVICPWQLYLTYGDKRVLEEQIESMKRWIEYIRRQGENEYLWNTGDHYGDWLGIDSASGSLKGASDERLIATAFYAYSTSLLIKSMRALGLESGEYESLYRNIVKSFQIAFPIYKTQTEYALALHFGLSENPKKTAASLAKLINDNGNRISIGFVGSAYLLYALSENGYIKLAYDLLLNEEYPSWFYPVKMGATTIWEQWDGVRKDGSLHGAGLNSLNHYAYGSVGGWIYEVAAGISPDETEPGFAHVLLKPHVDSRLSHLFASIDTVSGCVSSKWRIVEDEVHYEFEVPNRASLLLGGKIIELGRGKHLFRQPKESIECEPDFINMVHSVG